MIDIFALPSKRIYLLCIGAITLSDTVGKNLDTTCTIVFFQIFLNGIQLFITYGLFPIQIITACIIGNIHSIEMSLRK